MKGSEMRKYGIAAIQGVAEGIIMGLVIGLVVGFTVVSHAHARPEHICIDISKQVMVRAALRIVFVLVLLRI